MKPIDFHPEAAQEANEAVDHYDGLHPGLGEDFRTELAAALRRIRQSPKFYAIDRKGIRVCPLDRFPYSVRYEEFDDRIWIAAIPHHKRRPGYWSHRRPS